MPLTPKPSRRKALAATLGLSALSAMPYTWTSNAQETTAPRSANDRWRIGAIGMRYQGSVITREAMSFGDVVAICDVDRHVREQARASFNSQAAIYENYNDLIQRKDIDVVLIGTPDHWHAKMVIDACRAGKDVYVEKPLTLTIDEGKIIQRIAKETGRVIQVGSWQRSDARFRLAVEMVQAGRIGTLQRVFVVMGKNSTGGPFSSQPVPKHFNWDLWQGQTPDAPYIPERSHYTFRWWYEYAGGEMTDTGAHHLDIAQWAIGMQNSGPSEIIGTAKFPSSSDGFNVAIDYHTVFKYANGVTLTVLDSPQGDYNRNGVMFEGENGRIFVNRGAIAGKAVDELERKPLTRGDFKLYSSDNLDRPERSGKIDSIKNHMGNFYDCTITRKLPISDIQSQHRSATLCHLGNISQRLGTPLKWDPEAEKFIDSPAADKMLRRDQRKGYEVA